LPEAMLASCIFLAIAAIAWFFPLIGGGLGLGTAIIEYLMEFPFFLYPPPEYVQWNLIFLLPLSLGSVISLKFAQFRIKRAYSNKMLHTKPKSHPWWHLSSFILLVIPGIWWLILSNHMLSPLCLSFIFLLLALLAWVLPIIGGLVAWALSFYLFRNAIYYQAPAVPLIECFFLIIGGIVSIILGIILVLETKKSVKRTSHPL
jgi:hypothetical protein